MATMNPVLEIDNLALKYYGPNQEEREFASRALEERLFLREGSNGERSSSSTPPRESNEALQACETALITVFAESSLAQTLIYVAQAAVQWTTWNTQQLPTSRRQVLLQRVGDCIRRVGLSFAAMSTSAQGLPNLTTQLPPDATTRGLFGGATPVAVLKSLCTCYAQLLKLGLENEPYPSEAVEFPLQMVTLATNDVEYRVGLILMDIIVTEFSNYIASKSETYLTFIRHRSCSNNFRDGWIMQYFQTSLEALKRLAQQASQQTPGHEQEGFAGHGPGSALLSPQHPHLEEVVNLVHHCLSYDFMAIIVDETEEMISSQFPASWRSLLLQDDTHLLLWKSLAFIPLPHCTTFMRGLRSLCGIRRTLFDQEDRQAYLTRVFTLFIETFQYGRGDRRMEDGKYIAAVAEACLRFVAPLGYRDLHLTPMFLPWATVVKDATLSVLGRRWDGEEGGSGNGGFSCGGGVNNELGNGVAGDSLSTDFSAASTCFLEFWARISSSMRLYVKAYDDRRACPSNASTYPPSSFLVGMNSEGSNSAGKCSSGNGSEGGKDPTSSVLKEFAVEVITAFCVSRISPHVTIPLTDDTASMQDAILSQCESVTTLCTLDPSKMLQQLAEYLEQLGLPNLCTSSASSIMWLFYLAGCMVRWVLSNVEENEVVAESHFLRACVECVKCRRSLLNAMNQEKQRVAVEDSTSLFGPTVDTAQMHFFTYMQLILCTDRMHPSLVECVNLVFESAENMHNFLISELVPNLLRGVPEEQQTPNETVVKLIKGAIDLIGVLCSQMPANTSKSINFYIPPVMDLPLSRSIHTYRLRTNLYHMLWTLRMPSEYTPTAFYEFLAPIDSCLQQSFSGNATNPSYIAGWLRDLRGVARSVSEKTEAKADFVVWFCERSQCFHTILDRPSGDSPLVIISFLRFLSELIMSKHSHYLLDRSVHSANGLMLFKVVCKFIQQIVERCITDENIQVVVSSCGPSDGAYVMMLKPLSLCMGLLRICVVEHFVPFGAMWFYQDDTYDKTLLGLLRMLAVFPNRIFKEYPKVSKEILRLLRGVAEENVYHPLEKLSTEELQTVLFFVINRCEDVMLPTDQLLNGISFLSFIAEFIVDVKKLLATGGSQQGWEERGSSFGNNGGRTAIEDEGGHTPPPASQPSAYYAYGMLSSVSGTGGLKNGQPGISRPIRAVRRMLASRLEPIADLWTSLIRVGIGVIVHQDRAVSASCGVVFPILEAHPPFWYEFCEQFIATYPIAKQASVRDALAALTAGATTSEAFFSEVFSFRQTMRDL